MTKSSACSEPATSAFLAGSGIRAFRPRPAIDTALPSGEEFPRFREFWIERPKATDKRLTIYALLDSRARPAPIVLWLCWRDTVVDVQSKVYLRDKVGKLGVAPLTSMFLFGPNQPSPTTNYRPELHDSNGLSILAGNGEWIWRPLNNPKHRRQQLCDGEPARVWPAAAWPPVLPL